MKVGIIGAGNVGTALAKRLAPHGHEIVLSYSRDAAKLARTAASLSVRAGTPAEATMFGGVVALTVPWPAVPAALTAMGPLGDTILWDCTNALREDQTGLAIGTTTSGGEEIAKLVPGVRVIKGIPPFAELMHADDPTIGGRPPGLFVAGDDPAARAIVASLLAQLPAEVIDAGDLTGARFIEPAMWLLVRLAYAQGLGPRISLDLLREKV